MRVIVNEKFIFRLLLADMQGANVVCGSARQYKLINYSERKNLFCVHYNFTVKKAEQYIVSAPLKFIK